jgi:hypothetical protein
MEFKLNIGKNSLKNGSVSNADLAAQRNSINEALARFGIAESDPVYVRPHGRLLFGLDLTASREPSLMQARLATASMFKAVAAIGTIKVKFLCRSMRNLACESGCTQIGRILRLALSESEKLSALVFVGDHCHDELEALPELARELGRKSIPIFIFHECKDNDRQAIESKPMFKKLAELSSGAYVNFKPNSGKVLRELLSNVAVFSAAGSEGFKRMPFAWTKEARNLQGQLRSMLGDGESTKR